MEDEVLFTIFIFLGQLYFGFLTLKDRDLKANPNCLSFRAMKDKRILEAGDQLAFVICVSMALLTFINALLLLVSDKIPNFSIFYFIICPILVLPIRFFFILSNKNRSYEELPRIWPFKKD